MASSSSSAGILTIKALYIATTSMGKARGLRKTSRVVGEGAKRIVYKPRPVAKTKRVLHKEVS